MYTLHFFLILVHVFIWKTFASCRQEIFTFHNAVNEYISKALDEALIYFQNLY